MSSRKQGATSAPDRSGAPRWRGDGVWPCAAGPPSRPPWAGGLSGKRLFLLRASELVGSKLASPARGNS